MTTYLLDEGWTFSSDTGRDELVALPHDAMIAERRSATASSGNHGGYFHAGRYHYSRHWTAPEGAVGRHQELIFDGIHGEAVISVDGRRLATSRSPQREVAVDLDGVVSAGTSHLIEVDVDATHAPSARWYTGAGLFRNVWIENVPRVHLRRDTIVVRTLTAVSRARVQLRAEISGADHMHDTHLEVTFELTDPDGVVVATGRGPVLDDTAVTEVLVDQARLWSADCPHLYTVTARLFAADEELHERRSTTGLRRIEVDPVHGLRVNGDSVLLRGACVHHDHGPLGAATFRAAERRRVRILKQNGYNAIRSSHYPASRELLDACDEFGMYVIDELTDVWYQPKTLHDAAIHFEESWRDDARGMVGKARSHPCVIMYSVGNEVAESASPRGVETAWQLSDFIRNLDPDRPTTLAVNFLLNVMASFGRSPFTQQKDRSVHEAGGESSAVTSTMANVLADKIGGLMQAVARLPRADKYSRDALAAVDVAGYNYAWARYRSDAARHPGRVVLGTESLPGDITKIWPLVKELPNVIGDFAWTGWDYLGESGIGTWTYSERGSAAPAQGFPQLVAGAGTIDITGIPGPQVLLARAVWGQLSAPQIAVRPLDLAGQKTYRRAWRSSDAIASWAWSGCNGRTADVEVYSGGDEVEVILNGRSLGRCPAGSAVGYVTRYRTPYEPGEIVAVGFIAGVETGRSVLRSAGEPHLRVTPEDVQLDSDTQGLAFLRFDLADQDGVTEQMASDLISVTVSGPATLAALASAAPATTESYTDAVHTTHYGSALAVIRSTGETGVVRVDGTSQRHGSAAVELIATNRNRQPLLDTEGQFVTHRKAPR